MGEEFAFQEEFDPQNPAVIEEIHSSKPNRFFIIFVLGALSTVSPLAIDMYLPAFNQIAADLHTLPAKVALSVSSYFVGLAGGQLIYGPLLDRYGRKKPLVAGLLLFMVASLACVRAQTVGELVGLRLVQALGGCAAQVAAMAMVRDFFPVRETAKILSLLILILGVSPLLGPSIGSLVTVGMGWQWVFVLLAVMGLAVLGLICLLPEGHRPDPTISLHPWPTLCNFAGIVRNPQFFTYAVSGAFAFAGILVYVAGSPIIFMGSFHVTPHVYGAIFATLAVGFIGSNQVNILLLRWFRSAQIFRGALLVECVLTVFFTLGSHRGWFGLGTTLVLLFVLLSFLGLTYPNAAALALIPFDKNAGSAAALLGFIQIGAAALASACVGFFNSQGILPVLEIFTATAWIALLILTIGGRRRPQHIAAAKTDPGVVLH